MRSVVVLFTLLSLTFIGACHHGKGHRRHGQAKKPGIHFKKMDVDKDGKVSKSEFEKAHSEKFTKMDKDKDGFLSKKEFNKAHRGKVKAPCKDCKKHKCNDCKKNGGNCDKCPKDKAQCKECKDGGKACEKCASKEKST